ncbi:MAG: FadR/GntR family transcriptional regulator [Stackebrandtia sp.]
MDFQAVERSCVSDQVFRQLRDAILTGRLAAGEALPSERELAESFGVNRHAVREAVRRLEQSNLVAVAQGGSTKVLDWRVSAGLDLAVALAQSGDVLPTAHVVRDMLEMRACVGADAARLCALRCDEALRTKLEDVVEAMDAADSDLEGLHNLDIQMWRLVVTGADNLAYLLAFNSLVNEAVAVSPVPQDHRSEELLDTEGHRRLVRLIAERRAEEAYACARKLLTPSLPEEKDRKPSS